MLQRHFMRQLWILAGSMLLLIGGNLPVHAQAASLTVPFLSTTAEGCQFLNRRLGSTDAAQDANLKSTYEKIMPRFSYSWSGKCEGNFISGLGELTESMDGRPASTHWKNVEPGKLDLTYFRYSIPPGDIRYIVNSEGFNEAPLSVTECLGIPSCKSLHDARIAFVGAQQVALEDQGAEKTVQTYLQAVAANEAQRQAAIQRMAQIERDVERKNREDRQRILAEQRQAQAADGTSNPLSTVGAVVQGMAAAGGRNAAQLQALGAALQGNPAAAGAGAMGGGSGGVDSGGLNVQGEQSTQFNYQGTFNQCVQFSVSTKTERYYAANTCGHPVNLFRCTVGSKIGGNCGSESQSWDSTTLRAQSNPNQHGYFEPGPSGAYAGGNFVFVACKEPYFPYVKGWNGRGFDIVQCRAYKGPR